MPPNALAIAREAQRAVAAAIGVRKGDVNQADGLLRRTACGSGNASDADADRRTDTAADSLRECLGDLWTHSALGLNEFGWYVGPGGLQIIAVANPPA